MWVFGYGSLMWKPGFEYEEKQIAVLSGYRRSFCMRSIHHRGTADNPGLVLALDPERNSTCLGLGFRVASKNQARTLDYLRERELVSAAYLEKSLSIKLQSGTNCQAVTYVIDTEHVQYCGQLDVNEQAKIIAVAQGGRGFNRDYLYQTVAKLDELGIADAELSSLATQVRAICAQNA